MKDRSLVEAWNRAVGFQISSKAQPDRLKDGILYVRVATSVWMHELQFMKQDIITKLNGIHKGSPVAQIRFFIGEVEAPTAKKEQPAPISDAVELKPNEKEFINGAVADVHDPELREAVKRAIIRSMHRELKNP